MFSRPIEVSISLLMVKQLLTAQEEPGISVAAYVLSREKSLFEQFGVVARILMLRRPIEVSISLLMIKQVLTAQEQQENSVELLTKAEEVFLKSKKNPVKVRFLHFWMRRVLIDSQRAVEQRREYERIQRLLDSVCEKEQISGGEDRLVGSEQTCRVVVVEVGVIETPISGEFMSVAWSALLKFRWWCPDETRVVPGVDVLVSCLHSWSDKFYIRSPGVPRGYGPTLEASTDGYERRDQFPLKFQTMTSNRRKELVRRKGGTPRRRGSRRCGRRIDRG
ncbi:hypothetical protein TREMEDRAFT_63760 [Tremella mesenterica DSM 1558]|uniref:uncharacterized protein n=1 Tax=Tremella mesenterica (strain ATCC 24925 / CBS 8224 / DSM 1558 / NBRC 9311 / NRRL Y-6157 / RJB 2259-6 / UBC 559-6) TaxID=578456 RepID=UPI0003F49A59|nr:uncharacterized protein TREMEDRAFT_63760 [Tremella mesenterica DSM 1558]EIW67869.1 hypothetical protein TREMEDRAFT_63760 [Tremella mesenterica DSM 1558]